MNRRNFLGTLIVAPVAVPLVQNVPRTVPVHNPCLDYGPKLVDCASVSYSEIRTIDIDSILDDPNRFRLVTPRYVAHLEDSIEQNGLLRPITVLQTHDGYQLYSGFLRLETCKSLGHKTIKVQVLNV